MTSPSNAELREELRQIFSGTMVVVQEDDLDRAVELFQAREQQLLTELLGEAVEVNTVQYNYDNGDKVVAGFTNSAVPVEAIERLINAGKLDNTNPPTQKLDKSERYREGL